MSDTTADLPASLADRLADVPRDVPMALDLVAPPGAAGSDVDVRLRIITADPLEGREEGDRFTARHVRGQAVEVVGYISFGQAELDAELGADQMGWAMLLGRAAHALVDAASAGYGEGRGTGDDPLAEMPTDPASLDGWRVEQWRDYSIGVLIDIAEAADGPMGFPDAPMTPDRPPKVTEGCAGCAGTLLHPPHLPLDVAEGLCTVHQRQHEHWIAEHLPMDDEDLHTLHSLILDMDAVYVSGVGAAIARIDAGEDSPAALLRRARSWFDQPGGLSAVYADDDELAAALEQAAQDIKANEGTEAGLSALEDLRFLVPEACWLMDMDGLVWFAEGDPRQRELLDHVLTEHGDEAGAVLGAAEMHERLGDRDDAVSRYRMAWTRGLASGQTMIAEVAEAGLKRLGEAPPQPSGRVGRNDPCPCGSGKKFKKCCGR